MLSLIEKVKKLLQQLDTGNKNSYIAKYDTLNKQNVFANINNCTTINMPETSDLQEQLKGNVQNILQLLGYDLNDPHLIKTPDRVARVYIDTLTYAYHKNRILKSNTENPQKALIEHILDACSTTTFPYDEAYDDVHMHNIGKLWLVLYPIRVYSYCSHHILPVFGDVLIAYKPSNQIIGLSKLARIAKYIAKQLIVQEEYTKELATVLHIILNSPVFVLTEFRHMCMEMRGVQETGSVTVVSYGIDVYEDNIDKILQKAKKQNN